MKDIKLLAIIFLFFIVFISCKAKDEPFVPFLPAGADLPDYRNYFGICWNGVINISENLAYAKQMGYGYVFYMTGMEKDPLSDNLYFYIESPDYNVFERFVDISISYSTTDIDFYNNYCTLKSNDPFPNNLATGGFINSTTFTVILDYQQKKVIDWSVDKILAKIKAIESVNPKFHFGGFSWDVPDLVGDFWTKYKVDGGKPTTLAYWMKADTSFIFGKNVHNYATHTDGTAEFYKALFAAVKAKYPNFRNVMEPYLIWDNWIDKIKNRSDAKLLMPDMLAQENAEVTFLDDSRIFTTYGTNPLIDKEHVGSTAPANFTEQANRLNAAKLAINKSWFNWFGRLGGTGDMPLYKSLRDVPARLKLIRALPNWENLNNTPITSRIWNGVVYKSPNAYTSDSALSILQPKTGKQFVIFHKVTGVVDLPAGKTVKTISSTDGLFYELSDVKDNFIITSDNKLKPANSSVVDQCYIVKFQ